MKEFQNKLIVHGLMKINDKYLVIKRSIIKRGKSNVYPEYWDIPGGSVEDFETPVEALIREAKEEVNLRRGREKRRALWQGKALQRDDEVHRPHRYAHPVFDLHRPWQPDLRQLSFPQIPKSPPIL